MKDLRRPLRIGWMARRRIAAVVGLIPQDNDLPKVTEKRRGKLIVNTDKLAAHASFPEFLEELHDLDNGASFTLFEARNPGSPRVIGIGFKYTDSMGRPRLTWFRMRDMAEVMKRLTVRFREAAGRYGDFHQPLPSF